MTKMTEHRVGRKPLRGALLVAALMAMVWMPQSTRAQSDSSLGDVARKARADRADSKASDSAPAAQEAKRLAAALEEEQEEASAAPDGFQSYQAEGYRVWVPAPFSIEGRDDDRVLLATADITGVTTKVLAFTPIHYVGHPDEIEFNRMARSFWQPYGSIGCEKRKTEAREHRCTVWGRMYDQQFSGTVRFVEGDNRIVPVVCFATAIPDEKVDMRSYSKEDKERARDASIANMGRHSAALRSSQLCEMVLGSIRLKEDMASAHAAVPRVVAVKGPVAAGAGGTSLGEVARVTRQQAAQSEKPRLTVEAEDTIVKPPAGYRVRTATRCASECWQETMFLPENARRITGGNSDNVYVAMLDNATSVILYFGTTDVSNGYSEYGMAQDVAHRWIHAQHAYPSPDLHMARTVGTRQVPIVRSKWVANMNAWTQQDAQVGTDGLNMNIGCIAREDRFSDAESICSTVMESWRVHRE